MSFYNYQNNLFRQCRRNSNWCNLWTGYFPLVLENKERRYWYSWATIILAYSGLKAVNCYSNQIVWKLSTGTILNCVTVHHLSQKDLVLPTKRSIVALAERTSESKECVFCENTTKQDGTNCVPGVEHPSWRSWLPLAHHKPDRFFKKNRQYFLNAERRKISNQILNICCRINPERENLKNTSNALMNTTSPFSSLSVTCNYDN